MRLSFLILICLSMGWSPIANSALAQTGQGNQFESVGSQRESDSIRQTAESDVQAIKPAANRPISLARRLPKTSLKETSRRDGSFEPSLKLQASHAPSEKLPKWMVKPDLLQPLNSLASCPDALVKPTVDSQVIVLLWQPELNDQVLTVEQLKRLVSQQPTVQAANDFAGIRNGGVQLASFQEQDQEDKKTDAEDSKQEPKVEPESIDPESKKRIEQLQERIAIRKKQVEENEAMDAGTKNDANSQLNLASNWIQQATMSLSYLDSVTKAKNQFEAELKRLQEAQTENLPTEQPSAEATLEVLAVELQEKQNDLESLNTSLKDLLANAAERQKEITQLPALRKQTDNDIKSVGKEIDKLEEETDDAAKQQSLLVLESKRLALELKAKELTLKSQRIEQQERLLPLQRDKLEKRIKWRSDQVKKWRGKIESIREAEIKKQQEDAAREARKAFEENSPTLKVLAKRNKELADARAKLTSTMSQLQEEKTQIDQLNNSIEDELREIQTQIETVGITTSTGIMLIEHRRGLASTAKSRHRLMEIGERLKKTQSLVLELEEERQRQAEPDRLEALLAEEPKVADAPVDLKETAETRLETQLKLIDDLTKDYKSYRKQLLGVEVAHRELITNVTSSKEFSDENALWIPNAKTLSTNDLASSVTGFQRFFDRSAWWGLLESVGGHVSRQPYEVGLLVLVIGGLMVFQRRLRWNDE